MSAQVSTSSVQPAGGNEKQPLISRIQMTLAVVGIIAVTLLLIVGLLWLADRFPAQIEAVRDIFIIFLALGSCLSGIVILVLMVMIVRLVNMLEFEIKPILEKTNETLGLVRGTTTFVSTNVVKPTITASSYVAGVRRGIRVLFGNPKRNLPD